MSWIVRRALPLKQRTFGTLDAIRGLAAVAVVMHHAPDLFAPFVMKGGWLAVDLFFCLSGFVIAHAYGADLSAGLRFRDFMLIRLARLYPLFLLSIAIAVGLMIAAAILGNGTWERRSSILPSLFFLPTPFAGTLYPLNLPAWSLGMELLINAAAALIWRRLTSRNLAIVIGISGALLILFSFPLFRLAGGDTWETLHLGLLRVTFSFFAGVAVYRLRNRWRVRVYPIALLALLVGCLAVAAELNQLSQLIIVMVGFPALVAAGAHVEPGLPSLAGLAGRLSYGLYVLHSSALSIARPIASRLEATAPYSGAVALGLLILGCWIVDRYFDQPVRRWLLNPMKLRAMRSVAASRSARTE